MLTSIIIAIAGIIAGLFGWHKSVVATVKADAAKEAADLRVQAAEAAATVKVATVEKAAETVEQTIKGASDVQSEVVKLDAATVADKLRDGWTSR